MYILLPTALMKRLLHPLTVLLVMFCFVLSAHAAPFQTAPLPLRGEATYTYWGFTVYKARLFVPADIVDVQQSLGKTPLRLELTYARDLKREDFIESGAVFMKDNKEIPFQTVSQQNEQMNALYQNVKEGDTYAIEFLPGKGTTLYYNGEPQGMVPGDAFAASFLGIWLSRYSLKQSFTEELLGLDS